VPVNPASMAVPPPQTSTSVTTTGFMLTFNSSAAPLAQGVYTFEHQALGRFDMLIVPGGQGVGTYTAVFNMLTSTPAVHFRPPNRIQPATKARSGAGTGATGRATGVSGVQGSDSPSSSPRGPAEQQMEPVLREGLEPKLLE
jgi:hypothetical protein